MKLSWIIVLFCTCLLGAQAIAGELCVIKRSIFTSAESLGMRTVYSHEMKRSDAENRLGDESEILPPKLVCTSDEDAWQKYIDKTDIRGTGGPKERVPRIAQ